MYSSSRFKCSGTFDGRIRKLQYSPPGRATNRRKFAARAGDECVFLGPTSVHMMSCPHYFTTINPFLPPRSKIRRPCGRRISKVRRPCGRRITENSPPVRAANLPEQSIHRNVYNATKSTQNVISKKPRNHEFLVSWCRDLPGPAGTPAPNINSVYFTAFFFW